MNPGTYYAASAGPAPVRAALRGRVDARVCVVGGGFAGLATAIGLIERGVRDVVIVEGETIGHGASGRNGGFVFGGFSLDNAQLLADQGPAGARARCTASRATPSPPSRRRIAQYAIACDAVEAGVVLATGSTTTRSCASARRSWHASSTCTGRCCRTTSWAPTRARSATPADCWSPMRSTSIR